MKKSFKKIILSLAILVVTLAAGFAITAVSFNLFDAISPNQMKILFASDVLFLAAIATGVWYFFDSKKAKTKRKKEMKKRHNERINKYEKEMAEISELINFAA